MIKKQNDISCEFNVKSQGLKVRGGVFIYYWHSAKRGSGIRFTWNKIMAFNNGYYFIVNVEFDSNIGLDLMEKIKVIAVEKFNSQGVEEYSANESEVDNILGDLALSGGDLPWEVLMNVDKTFHEKKRWHLKFYFSEDNGSDNIEVKMQENAEKFSLWLHQQCGEWLQECTCEKHCQQNWSESWKEYYQPIKISELLEVVPSFYKETYNGTAQNKIFIYPGRGFGTGGHQTTFLCLQLLSGIIKKNSNASGNTNVLDFGCGSGILGIAAKKMGAKKIFLYDIDESALENVRQNLPLNFSLDPDMQIPMKVTDVHKIAMPALRAGVQIQESFTLTTNKSLLLSTVNTHNLIFANILLNILLEEANLIISLLAPKGLLILSGVLVEQISELKDKYLQSKELKFIEEKVKDNWGALLFKKETT